MTPDQVPQPLSLRTFIGIISAPGATPITPTPFANAPIVPET